VLQVIGAGLPRTGTNSLRVGLERLLGRECYHMFTVKADPAEAVAWTDALHGNLTEVHQRLARCAAAVDWPAAFFWRELLAANPRALVVLSVREDPLTWWRSFDATVLERKRCADRGQPPPGGAAFAAMRDELLLRTFGPDWAEPDVAMAAYDRHNADVREQCANLLEWAPADGWPPLCAALGIEPPDEPFPRTNSTTEFFA
jgi:hypothetical protein